VASFFGAVAEVAGMWLKWLKWVKRGELWRVFLVLTNLREMLDAAAAGWSVASFLRAD
jgi:hypothetical protein